MPSFAGNQQQDAHELTRFLLERLRLEFVRGIQLVATQAAKENGKLLPRGNEHGIGANVMGDLGIPVPMRRTRTSRCRQQLCGKSWTGSNINHSIIPSQHCGGNAVGVASLESLIVGLGHPKKSTPLNKDIMVDGNGRHDGHVIISRWGAVRHRRGCLCRPCQSRRRKDGINENPASSYGAFKHSSESLAKEESRKSVDDVAAHRESNSGRSGLRTETRVGPSTFKAHQGGFESNAGAFLSDVDCDFGLPSDPVWRLFGGMALNQIHCFRCGHANSCQEPFLDISLTIPSVIEAGTKICCSEKASCPSQKPCEVAEMGEGPDGCATLQQCLAVYTRDEKLSGSAMYACDHCGSLASTSKQTKLQSLPPVLCLHIKRFTWRGSENKSKLNTHVYFPLENLDLAPYMESVNCNGKDGESPSIGVAAGTHQSEKGMHPTAKLRREKDEIHGTVCLCKTDSPDWQERGSKSPDWQGVLKTAPASCACADRRTNHWSDATVSRQQAHVRKSTPVLYDLSGVVVHHGPGAASGHYTVFTRSDSCKTMRPLQNTSGNVWQMSTAASKAEWLQFNDDKVVQVTPEEVKQCDGYIFFYTRQTEKNIV